MVSWWQTERRLTHGNIIPAKCHSMKTLTQDCPTANKATFTQYGVITLDSLLEADLSEPAVYKPRGLRTVCPARQKPKGKNTAVWCEISASNKTGHGVLRGNHNMLEEDRVKPHWQTLVYPHPLYADTIHEGRNLCLDMLTETYSLIRNHFLNPPNILQYLKTLHWQSCFHIY